MATDSARAIAALGEVALADERERVERILEIARETLGMQIAYFSRFTSSEQIVNRIAGAPPGFGEGMTVPTGETFCQRMLDEEIPSLVPDAREQPALSELRATIGGHVVAYVGVPLQLSSGRIYGTLCAASRDARRDLNEQDVAFMRVLARLLADAIEHPPPLQPAWEGAREPQVDVDQEGRVAHLSLWFAATPRAVQAARRALEALADWVPEERMHDLQIVGSELVTNSVRHAGIESSSAVGLDVVVEPGLLRARVTDPGTGFDPAAIPAPEPSQIGGWGLHIVERMTDRWGVDRSAARGAHVWFEMDLPAQAA